MNEQSGTEDVLTVEAARETAAMREAQALRGDTDRADPYGVHLLVREGRRGRALACARLLEPADALEVGGFACQREFDLTRVLRRPQRLLEVDGIRVAAGRRDGAVLAALWSGLARVAVARGAERLLGLVRAPFDARVPALSRALEAFHAADEDAAPPRRGLPAALGAKPPRPVLPPLLADYLRLGAELAGPPAWDPEAGTATFLALASVERLAARAELRFPLPRAAAVI